jgi:hypothetical protein
MISQNIHKSQWNMDQVLEQEIYHVNSYTLSPWAIDQFLLRTKWLNIMLQAEEAALEIVKRNIAQDLFSTFAFLGARWVSHHQAIHDLLMHGRYGETIAIQRMLFEVTDCITYFRLYPEEATAWRQWSIQDPLANSPGYKSGVSQFSQSKIKRKIEAKGETPFSLEYQRLSAVIHPNEWGTKFFLKRQNDNSNKNELDFGTPFDMKVAFQLLSSASHTLPQPIKDFLIICKKSRAPKSVWRAIKIQNESIRAEWEVMLETQRNYAKLIEEVEARLNAGESFSKIKEDIDKRFKTT